MSKFFLFAVFVFLAVFFLGSLSDVVYYPDGPFSVGLMLDGSDIRLASDFSIHSSTVVVEHRVGSSYSKSSGASSISDFYLLVQSGNVKLDSWFVQGSVAPQKDLYVYIKDGAGRRIEAWKLYRVSPVGKVAVDGGNIKYLFRASGFERDLDVVAPLRS